MRTIAALLAALFLVPAAMPGYADGTVSPDRPVSFVEAVQAALSRSREARIAERDLGIARQGRRAAQAGWLPRVDAQGSYTMLSDAPAVLFQGQEVQMGDQDVRRAQVTADQTIYDFGKTGARVAQADARVEVSSRRSERTREQVAQAVIAAFLAARRAGELKRVADESLAAAQEHRKVAGDLYDSGVVARNDVLAADVRVANEEAALISAENRVKLSRSALALRMGFSGERVVVPAPGEFPVPTGPLPPFSESVRIATEKRTDLRAIQASVREGEEAVSAARAAFAPTLFGEGGYSYTSDSFNPNPNTFSLLLGGRVNLFSGFADTAAVREASLTVERRKDQRDLLRDQIALSVKRAHLGVVEAQKRKAVAEVAVARAQENLRIENNRYREGLAIATEVLDAQALLTRAKVDRANATFDLYEARYNLLFERGELLDFLGPLLGSTGRG